MKNRASNRGIFRIRRCERCGELAEFLYRPGPGAHKFFENVCSKCRDELRIEKRHAMGQVTKASKQGDIHRQDWCEICGRVPGPMRDGRTQIVAHHPNGYERPLDIWWICHQCNQRIKGYECHSGKYTIEQVRGLLGAESQQ